MPLVKKCPFCGSSPRKIRHSGDERNGYLDKIEYHCVTCTCTVTTEGKSSGRGYADNQLLEERALFAWNTRVPVE